jgi:hypothetical protein
MPSTYTPSLRLEEQGVGENNNTWGAKLNATFDLVDKTVAGHVSVSTTGGTKTLTVANGSEDESRYKIVEIEGTLSSTSVIQVPEVSKEYVVWDSTVRGGFGLSFRLGASGNTIVIPDNAGTDSFSITTDGTNWRATSINAATTVKPGSVELATDAEAQTGTDTVRALTAANLQSVTATALRKGVVELATDAEAQTGTDTTRALTPANLQSVTATTTRKGVVELATDTETATGTDTTRALTPANLKSVTDVIYTAFTHEVGEVILFAGNSTALNKKYVQGWRIADGTDSTPNLTDSFPKLGTFAQRTGTGGAKNITPSGSVSVAGHTLSINQMPSHNHTFPLGPFPLNPVGSGGRLPFIGGNSVISNSTNSQGGSQSHNHGGSFSGSSHTNEPQFTYLVPLYFTGVAGTYP